MKKKFLNSKVGFHKQQLSVLQNLKQEWVYVGSAMYSRKAQQSPKQINKAPTFIQNERILSHSLTDNFQNLEQ
jgi:hypothetical protein